MSTLEILSQKGTEAVKKLREQKLKKGLPFMINDKDLPANQCYMEYPDGSIKLFTVVYSRCDMDVIRELTSTEATYLRNRFHLSPIK